MYFSNGTTMEIFLILLSLTLILLGYVGAFVPGLSGPPLAWLAIFCIYFIPSCDFPTWLLILLGLIALISLVLEWIVPAYGAKVFKGSNYGIWGSYIGLFASLILPIPYGFIIGPFVGAFIGELMFDSKDLLRALKAAFGTFVGFLFGVILNFAVVSLIALIWIIYVIKFFLS